MNNLVIDSCILDSLESHIQGASRAVVVTDSNVAPIYGERVMRALEKKFRASMYVMPAGEKNKNAQTLCAMLQALVDASLTRDDIVVALGGGVVGDVAGFAAAIYMRGIRVVQVPTTLLAMIDSSIGGKTGIDIPEGKNLIGAFHMPTLVYADVEVLRTLSTAEWKNGLGEGVKYACLAGGRIHEILRDGLCETNLAEFIRLCAKYKSDVVAADERESGQRRLLNFGHTLGHAIERASDFNIPHGVAVANGIEIMARAAVMANEADESVYEEVDALLRKYDLLVKLPFEGVFDGVRRDKKAVGNDSVIAVAIRDLGRCETRRMTFDEFERYVTKAYFS